MRVKPVSLKQQLHEAAVLARACWQKDRRVLIKIECELEGFVVRTTARNDDGGPVAEVNMIIPFTELVSAKQNPLAHAINLAFGEMQKALNPQPAAPAEEGK